MPVVTLDGLTSPLITATLGNDANSEKVESRVTVEFGAEEVLISVS